MSKLLPPRGIFVATDILFTPDIWKPARDTLIQLMALAWSSADHCTPTLSLAHLEQLTGKKARTLRQHLAYLSTYQDVVRVQSLGRDSFTLSFAGWLYGRPPADGDTRPSALDDTPAPGLPAPAPDVLPAPGQDLPVLDATPETGKGGQKSGEKLPGSGRNLPAPEATSKTGKNGPKSGEKSPVSGQNLPESAHLKQEQKEYEEEEDSTDSGDFLPPPLANGPVKGSAERPKSAAEAAQNVGKTASFGADSAGAESPLGPGAGEAPRPAIPELPPKLQASLEKAGVFSGLIPEIARIASEQGWKAKDLRALLAWCVDDSPDRPGGLFVARIRRGFRPPKQYYHPACPYCGSYGKHEQGCPRSYVVDYRKY